MRLVLIAVEHISTLCKVVEYDMSLLMDAPPTEDQILSRLNDMIQSITTSDDKKELEDIYSFLQEEYCNTLNVLEALESLFDEMDIHIKKLNRRRSEVAKVIVLDPHTDVAIHFL